MKNDILYLYVALESVFISLFLHTCPAREVTQLAQFRDKETKAPALGEQPHHGGGVWIRTQSPGSWQAVPITPGTCKKGDVYNGPFCYPSFFPPQELNPIQTYVETKEGFLGCAEGSAALPRPSPSLSSGRAGRQLRLSPGLRSRSSEAKAPLRDGTVGVYVAYTHHRESLPLCLSGRDTGRRPESSVLPGSAVWLFCLGRRLLWV